MQLLLANNVSMLSRKNGISMFTAMTIVQNKLETKRVCEEGRNVFCPVPPKDRKKWVEGFVRWSILYNGVDMDVNNWVAISMGVHARWRDVDENGAAIVINYIRKLSPRFDRDWAAWSDSFDENRKMIEELRNAFEERW